MDPKALHQITYGLYLLTAQENGQNNGCIVNTVMQVTEQPTRIALCVLKNNLTHDMILRTGKLAVSALTTAADFELFRRFGMQSGRTADKFSDFPWVLPCKDGLLRLSRYANAYFSGEVIQRVDLDSHSLFLAQVNEAESLSQEPPCTYAYYQSHIKPAPAQSKSGGRKWVCDVCGWVYDEEKTGIQWEDLPEDFVCPLCKHGKADFSPLT